MKLEHELFAHHYILTGDKNEAYKKAYPHASGEPLKIAARKLINRPEVREFIAQELANTRQQAALQYHQNEQKRLEEEYATMLLKRKKLREIISGEVKQKKYFKFKDRLEVVEVEYSPFAVMRAIELDSKLENEWYKKQGGKTQEPPQPPEPQFVSKDMDFKFLTTGEQRELLWGAEYAAGMRARTVRDNPHMAEEYRKKGLWVLDYVPDAKEFQQMEEEHLQHMAELLDLKKAMEEREDEYATLIQEIEQGNFIPPADMPDPESLPTLYPGKNKNTPLIAISNDTKQHQPNVVSSTKQIKKEYD